MSNTLDKQQPQGREALAATCDTGDLVLLGIDEGRVVLHVLSGVRMSEVTVHGDVGQQITSKGEVHNYGSVTVGFARGAAQELMSGPSQQALDKPKADWFLWVGMAFTVVWIAGAIVLLVIRWTVVVGMELNNLADFAAGAFAPLAFLWLVLGYRQQGRELQLNTDALMLQAQELQNSVEQQRAHVYTAREQLDRSVEALAIERDRIRQEKLPYLSVVNEETVFSGSNVVYRLVLMNVGAVATEVSSRLIVPRAETIVRDVPFKRSVVRPETEYRGVITLRGPIHGSTQLEISYQDLFSQLWRATFELRPRNAADPEAGVAIHMRTQEMLPRDMG